MYQHFASFNHIIHSVLTLLCGHDENRNSLVFFLSSWNTRAAAAVVIVLLWWWTRNGRETEPFSDIMFSVQRVLSFSDSNIHTDRGEEGGSVPRAWQLITVVLNSCDLLLQSLFGFYGWGKPNFYTHTSAPSARDNQCCLTWLPC